MPIDFQLPPDVEEQTIAKNLIAAYQETGKTALATGDLLT